MRTFDLKRGWLVAHPYNERPEPGRTIHPEPMRLAEPGWAPPNHGCGEFVQRREADVEKEERDAAAEWLAHVEKGRINPEHRE